MAYSTIDKSSLHFNPKLYAGNSSTQSITGVGFQPDWVWIKGRNVVAGHNLHDAVRGVDKQVYTNNNNAQETLTTLLTSFDSDGFSLGNNGNANGSSNYVSWNWKAGGTGSSNYDGSITSTVSANTTAGFSIVKYTGNGSAGATVGHGLGALPATIIIKNLTEGARQWQIYHHKLNNGTNPEVKYLEFNTNGELDDAGSFNDTAPTSSYFTLGSANRGNENTKDFIAYCFAEKPGYSKFGSYEGNGYADGTYVNTGFKPAIVIVKRIDGAKNWYLWDGTRDPSNDNATNQLYPNLNAAEDTGEYCDLLSNGFKLKNTSNGNDTDTHIYLAFGQSLVGSNNIPTTAR